MKSDRQLERLVTGKATQDGAGVSLVRVFAHDLQHRLDPFLMLDHFHSNRPEDYIAGFPDHPHRGFETSTYMLAGRMRHRDSHGNQGLLQAGGMQWMTAGSGLIHSELPEQENGLMSGFQLWLNLAAEDKMIAPSYIDLQADQIPTVSLQHGIEIKVLAGAAFGKKGAIQKDRTEPLYLDVQLPAGQQLNLPIPTAHNAFLYPFEGSLKLGNDIVPCGQLAILSNSPQATGVLVQAVDDARFLLISGQPLHEPIVQWGPFVMNTREQVEQAVRDFSAAGKKNINSN